MEREFPLGQVRARPTMRHHSQPGRSFSAPETSVGESHTIETHDTNVSRITPPPAETPKYLTLS
jgi:hypothetical protein